MPHRIDKALFAQSEIGEVYIAIRPLKGYTIDADYKPAGEFDVVVSPGAKNAVIFDIATKKEFATFQAFQRAVNQNPPVVDWDQLSVTYTSLKGDTLTRRGTRPSTTCQKPKRTIPKGRRSRFGETSPSTAPWFRSTVIF